MATKVEAPDWDYDIWTVSDLLNHITNKTLKDDPIANRPSSVGDDANEKNIGIVKSILDKLGISTIILRDLSNAPRLQTLYGKSYKYSVIDGGHRCRALKWFRGERFAIQLKGSKQKYFWTDLDEDVRNAILNTKIPISIVKCNNKQAREIFINHNKQTKVKGYSIIMSDEESKICEFVRQQTKTWREYGTTCHQVFDVNNGSPVYFHGNAPNGDNLWDTYVFVAIHKIMNKGNVDAGEDQSKQLIDKQSTLTKKTQDEVKKFFDTLLAVYEYNEKSITLSYFGCFQAVYFELYQESGGNMKIEDMQAFAYNFQDAYDVLFDKKSTKRIKIGNELLDRREFLRTNSIAFTKSDVQALVAKIVLTEMGFYE
jgi:hypothetical protein